MKKLLLFLGLAVLASPAFAELGGLTKTTSLLSEIRVWLTAACVIVGMIVLIWTGLQIKFQKATWMDFLGRAAAIAVVGSIPTFGPWVYTYLTT